MSSGWKSKLSVVHKDSCQHKYGTSDNLAGNYAPSLMFTSLNSPQTLLAGMNKFLSQLEITFRRDPNNYRPRINKLNSIKVRSTFTVMEP